MIATAPHSRRQKVTSLPKPRKEPDKTRYSGRMAARLRELRDEKGVAPDDFAAKLTRAGYRVSAPTIYAWENGRLQVQVDALPYIARVLGCQIADLLPAK